MKLKLTKAQAATLAEYRPYISLSNLETSDRRTIRSLTRRGFVIGRVITDLGRAALIAAQEPK